jgi:hypothetical protein
VTEQLPDETIPVVAADLDPDELPFLTSFLLSCLTS